MSSTVSTATPALADLAEDAVGVAVEAVERWPVERGAEPHGPLLLGEEVEPRVGVLGQPQAREQPRRLLRRLGRFARVRRLLQVHLPVRRVGKGELARQPLAEQVPRDLPGSSARGSARRGSDKPVGVVTVPAPARPLQTPQHFGAEPLVLPRPAHLFFDVPFVPLDRVADLCERAHRLLPFASPPTSILAARGEWATGAWRHRRFLVVAIGRQLPQRRPGGAEPPPRPMSSTAGGWSSPPPADVVTSALCPRALPRGRCLSRSVTGGAWFASFYRACRLRFCADDHSPGGFRRRLQRSAG